MPKKSEYYVTLFAVRNLFKIQFMIQNSIRSVAIAGVLFLSGYTAQSQDIITLKDGRTVETVVIEVNKKDVVYRKFANPKGPQYRVEIKDVQRINYESGAVDEFSAPKNTTSSKSTLEMLPSEYGRNIISVDAFTLLFQNVELSYERIIGPQGRLGLRVPISVNMAGGNDQNIFAGTRNVMNTGLDFNFYPMGQGTSRMFIGPSVKVGQARTSYTYYDDLIGGNISTEGNSSYFAFLLRVGYLYTPVKELSLGFAFGLGTRRYFTNIPTYNAASGAANLQFSLGYRF